MRFNTGLLRTGDGRKDPAFIISRPSKLEEGSASLKPSDHLVQGVGRSAPVAPQLSNRR